MFGLGFSPWWMDPFVYEWSYHNISLDDPAIGLFGTADITAYVSGWQADKNTEYWTIMGLVAQALKASDKKVQGPSSVPIDFEYKGQVFHKAGIRRAFEGRAAPEEIRDATRLAFLAGRVRTPVSGPAYAKTWFGIDCNSFAGNYCGISPSTSIAAYAHGYTDAALKNGATEDVKTSRGLVPVPPVSSPDAIKAGTLLLTFGSADKNGNRWRHIAADVQRLRQHGAVGLLVPTENDDPSSDLEVRFLARRSSSDHRLRRHYDFLLAILVFHRKRLAILGSHHALHISVGHGAVRSCIPRTVPIGDYAALRRQENVYRECLDAAVRLRHAGDADKRVVPDVGERSLDQG